MPVEGVIGVAFPEAAAEEIVCGTSSTAGSAAVMSAGPIDGSVGAVPPRSGDRRCRVAAGCKARSATVLEGDRWRPECRSRTSDGRVVDADRKSRTSEMVLDGLTFKGMAAGVERLAVPGDGACTHEG